MLVTEKKIIKASIEEVWSLVTDIEKSKDRIECIIDIKILERPEVGVVGLKWEETRKMFGKESTETMWITEAIENDYYKTRAENCGCVYISTISLSKVNEGVELSMSFESIPQTFMAKLMTPMMFLMTGTIKKAFKKDLIDIGTSLEN